MPGTSADFSQHLLNEEAIDGNGERLLGEDVMNVK
jgi:hypothetical protein